jgi:molecular chaperone GrpE (heat shock protein)
MIGEDTSHAAAALAAAALPEDVPESASAQESQLLLARLGELEQSVAGLAAQVSLLAERVDPLPRQIRQVGSKVDDITESIGQPRLRDLLSSLLLLYDLACQMERAAEPASAAGYRVLCDQIMQMLAVNGITLIPAEGRFDPALHKVVDHLACASPEEDGQIASVYRAGFRTERAVLRYAEVIVRRYFPQESDDVTG